MTRVSASALLLYSALSVFLADRASKLFVIEILDLPAIREIAIVPPFLNFVMAWNTGINFGLFSRIFGEEAAGAQRWVLIGIALVISTALVWWALRRGTAALGIAAGIVVGGALGNAWDRIQYGAVADFLNMSCCGIDNPYAFNIADVAIFAGALAIALKA